MYLSISSKKVIEVNLIDVSCMGIIITSFCPLFHGIHSTIQSLIVLLFCATFLLGIVSADKNMAAKFAIVIFMSMLLFAYYYFQLYHWITTFTSCMNNSLRCILYSLMGGYYIKYGSRDQKGYLLKMLSYLIILTSLTTIIGNIINPGISREVGNSLNNVASREYYLRNIASWGQVYAMVFTLPMWGYLYKKRSKKMIYLATILAIDMTVIFSQITFALAIACVFTLFMFVRIPKKSSLLIISIIIALIFVFFGAQIGNILALLSNEMKELGFDTLALRFNQLSFTFRGNGLTGTFAGRAELYMMSFQTFLNSPLCGKRAISSDMVCTKSDNVELIIFGMHSQLFDMLAATGIIGMTVCIFAFYIIMHSTIRKIRHQYLYRTSDFTVVMLVALMFLNPTHGMPETYLATFLVPCLVDGFIGDEKDAIRNHNRSAHPVTARSIS